MALEAKLLPATFTQSISRARCALRRHVTVVIAAAVCCCHGVLAMVVVLWFPAKCGAALAIVLYAVLL